MMLMRWACGGKARREDAIGEQGLLPGQRWASLRKFPLAAGLFFLLSTTPLVGCANGSNPSPSKDAARRELVLRDIDYDGKTFVIYAREGDLRVVNLFLMSGMDPNARDESGDTVLLAAAKNKQSAVVKALAAGKADLNARDKDGLTALMFAARAGDSSMVRTLLDQNAGVNAKTDSGRTPLMYAAWTESPEIVASLLNKGASIDEQDHDVGTPLTWAAFFNRVDMAQALLDRGADVNVRNRQRGTPLMIAAARGNTLIVQLLLDNGADPRARDVDGKDSIKWAGVGHHEEAARLIQQAAEKRPQTK
jgi:ankyrin repeat protein